MNSAFKMMNSAFKMMKPTQTTVSFGMRDASFFSVSNNDEFCIKNKELLYLKQDFVCQKQGTLYSKGRMFAGELQRSYPQHVCVGAWCNGCGGISARDTDE